MSVYVSCKYTINDTIMNILFILFYNVFKTFESLCICWHTSLYLYSIACKFLSLGPTTKAAGSEFLLEMVLCSVRSQFISAEIRLASDRYIVSESVIVCQYQGCWYQVLTSNGLFEEANEQSIFSEAIYN